MSSMKQTDKKRSPTNNQPKRPARVESKETKLQQEKVIKTLRSTEANKKTSSPRVNSIIVVSDRNKNTKPSDVHEKLVLRSKNPSQKSKTLQVTKQESEYTYNNSSIDIDNEPNDERDESDSETVTDSLSTSGDSRSTEDDLHNVQINTSPSMSNKTKISPDYIPKYSVGNNSTSFKVHPKPPSTPSSISSEGFDSQDTGEPKEGCIIDEASNGVQSDNEALDVEDDTERVANNELYLKVSQMEKRIELLEDELREVAALEISLYSVVQEHGRPTEKMHEPAQRLSKLYIHTGKHFSQEKCATLARNIVSGMVMVFNSCGNDVPRLTFWWSNIVVFREIITHAFGSKQSNNPDATEFVDDWEEAKTFTSNLVKVESEIFSRIVESIWSQILTPNTLTNETTGRLPSGDQQQCNFSINLWQNAFRDALRRLCPVRAGGNECGCLPVLARMVMEQCVSRLDVAMLNAILCDSAYEISTDPIPESRVLPIPAGDLSFGSGAQLKKAVGNWSSWLSDSFLINTAADHNENGDYELEKSRNGELNWFHLLNSLSHLLMIPKDMIMDKSIRAEVCPSIGLPLLKRILIKFTPDEFCPDPVPNNVLEAINAELSEDNSRNSPYAVATIIYKPPSSTSVMEKVPVATGNAELKRQASMIQTKGYDELNLSPTFINEKLVAVKDYVGANTRYELIREVWSS